MRSNLSKMLVTSSTADFFARRLSNRAARRIGAGAALALVAACSGDDTKVTTGTGTSTSSTVAGSTTTTAGSSGTTTTSGTGGGGSMGSGGSGGSTTGAAGSGGASAGAGGAGGAVGAGGSAGASGAGGSGGAGACNTSPGKAIQFDGAAIDLLTGDLGVDLPGGDVPRTIELWAKFLGPQSWAVEHSLIETGYAPVNTANMVLGIDMSGDMDPNGPRQFGPYTNGFTDNNRAGNGTGGVVVPGIAQTGWFHLSWSYAGNHGAFSFTVNGVQYPVITQAGQPTMNFTAGIVTLGGSQSFGAAGWAGVMDEVRIWRVARTPQQILDNMRVVLRPTEPGLVAYYRLGEGSGTFTDDESMAMTHRLSTCTAMSTRCHAINTASPLWVTSDIPGTFTCAP